jgi:hypothetical protein
LCFNKDDILYYGQSYSFDNDKNIGITLNIKKGIFSLTPGDILNPKPNLVKDTKLLDI